MDRTPVAVNDHDFLSDADGVALPYGIYDPVLNRGVVSVGISHDTSAFAAHSIARWWKREGSVHYRNASRLLILADAGGSNSYSYNRWAWKTEIQTQLSNAFSLTVTHYPSGASEWNPIEHRLFSEISKSWAAEALVSVTR